MPPGYGPREPHSKGGYHRSRPLVGYGVRRRKTAADVEQRSSLTPSVSSAAEARWITRTVLSAWDLTDLEDLACLLVTELVTNVVLHAGSASELSFSFEEGRLHVGVLDDDARPPVLRRTSPWSTTGRGLALVDALAARWGWAPGDGRGGKEVWFELEAVGPHRGWRPAVSGSPWSG